MSKKNVLISLLGKEVEIPKISKFQKNGGKYHIGLTGFLFVFLHLQQVGQHRVKREEKG